MTHRIFGLVRSILAGLKYRSTHLLLALAMLGASAAPARAQDFWTGNGANGSWNDPNNWSAGVPTTGTDVVLNGGPAPFPGNLPNNYNIPTAIQFHSITLGSTAPINSGYNIGLSGAGVTPGLQSGGTFLDKNTSIDAFNTGLTLNGPATIISQNTTANGIEFNNPITGTGPLTLTATIGSINLRAVNSYTGATIVTAGFPLRVNAVVNGAIPTTSALTVNAGGSIEFFSNSTIGSLAGAGQVGLSNGFSNSIALTIGADNTSTTFSGTIDDIRGTNSLIKIGSGTLTLTGTSSYEGPTVINGGTLVVNGSIASSSLTTVNVGGTLAGTGVVGPTIVNGAIAPGPIGGIGTLNVNGAFTQNARSTFLVNVAGAASNNLLITGAATLNGGTVVANGSGAPDTVYTILTATGGRSGAFNGVLDNIPSVTADLLYDANHVYLVLLPIDNDIVAPPPGITRPPLSFNEASVLRALTGPGASIGELPLVEILASENDAQVRLTLNQLSGEVYASALSAGIENQALWLRTIAQHVRLANPCLCPATAAGDASGCDGDGVWHTWATPFGQAGVNQGDGNAHAFAYNSVGFAVGGDRSFGEQGLVGFAAGYSNWSNSTDVIKSSTNSNSFNCAGYARVQLGSAWLLGITSYEFDGYTSFRPMTLLGLNANARFSGHQLGEYLESGYALNFGGLQVQPLGALQYISAWRHSLSETGADALDLNVAGARADSFRTQVGSRLLYPITTGAGRCILPEAGAYWIHEYARNSREDMNQFAGGGPAFQSNGGNLGRDFALFTTGVSTQLGSNIRAGFYYMSYLTPTATAHGGVGQVQITW